ncbi:MAG TPA: hypothetical protein VFU23_05130, partial [Gemmatimonadales bacterium]|nr:hypothetical protein [Gemmatimonadales bacterium]
AARTARPGRPEVQVRGFGSGARAPAAETIVNDIWTRLGPVDSTVRVALVLYNPDEFGVRERWWAYRGASVTLQNGGVTCAAFLRSYRQKDGTAGFGRRAELEAVLAPCVMLARFGLPGPAVGPWLGATRFAAAGSTAWLNRSTSFIDGGPGALPWLTFYSIDREPTFRGLLSSSGIGLAIAQMLTPPYELGAYGLRCTDGDYAACRIGVLDATVIADGTRGLPPELTFSGALLDRPTPWTLGTPRPPGEWWLSDLIRDQGADKFARFWKSSGSFEQAFQNAFGEDLGAWTHRWSVRQWENSWYEKYRHQPRVLGATLEPSWLILTLSWAGAALMLTAWMARRRQVA